MKSKLVIKLYTTNRNKHCPTVRKLLKLKKIPFSEINAEETKILGRLDRDLGMKRLPGLLTPDGVYSGIDEILKYLKVGETEYHYIEQMKYC